MPAYARKDLMNPEVIEVHHLWSRCTGRAFLMGLDPFTGHDCSHRRDLAVSCIEYLASIFAVDVGDHHILSNHMHEILRNRPDIAALWSDEELCWRWKLAWPKLKNGQWLREPTDKEIEKMLIRGGQDPAYFAAIRRNLADLSWYQARLKQIIAWHCNRDGPIERRGHHWEARFGNRLLETDGEVLTAFLYTDLQQVRAGIAPSVEQSQHSAIERQIEAFAEESFQRMYSRAANESDADQQELDNLKQIAANAYLAPITDQGPRLGAEDSVVVAANELVFPAGYRYSAQPQPTASEQTAVEQVAADEVPVSAVKEEKVESRDEEKQEKAIEKAAQEDDKAAAGGPSTCESEPKKQRRGRPRASHTWTIHSRLRRRQRRRASRSAVLAIALDTYRQLLTRLTEQLRKPGLALVPIADVTPPLPPGAADHTDTASSWRYEVKCFSAWVQEQAAALPEQLLELLAAPRGDPTAAP